MEVPKRLKLNFYNRANKTPGLGPNGDCWEWNSRIDSNGYGTVYFYKENGREKYIKAHRLSWAITNGYVPLSTSLVCHTCDNRKCVNPSHLFIGTIQDNCNDKINKGRHKAGQHKLNPIDVCRIIRLLQNGESYRAIEKIIGIVSYSSVKFIGHKRQWKHCWVKPDENTPAGLNFLDSGVGCVRYLPTSKLGNCL